MTTGMTMYEISLNFRDEQTTALGNQKVQTDRTFPNNKPDIIIRDNEKGTCVLQFQETNLIKTEAKKILKYEDPTTKIHLLRNVKAKVIPVIVGETRTNSESFR